jgi:adenosylcobyric acid synthase
MRAAGKPLLGICGGFQMLAARIHDQVESGRGTVAGLGLLPVEVTFAIRKRIATPTGTSFAVPVHGYEIHHGYVSHTVPGQVPLITLRDGSGEGLIGDRGNIFATHWHGAFECDQFRRAFLTEAARLAGRHAFTVAGDTRLAALREDALDILADLVEEHLDTAALWQLVDDGAPAGLPFIPPGAADEQHPC